MLMTMLRNLRVGVVVSRPNPTIRCSQAARMDIREGSGACMRRNPVVAVIKDDQRLRQRNIPSLSVVIN